MYALGGWGIIVGMALESAGAPVPSEVVLPFAGFLVWQGRLTMPEALAYATLGQMAGSVAAYLIGLHGGRPLVLKYHRRLLLKERHLVTAETWFAQHGERAVLVGRLLPVVRSVISYPAGMAGMPLGRFALYSLLGLVPFTWGFTYAGFKLGENWEAARLWLDRFDYAAAALAAAATLFAGFRRARRRRRLPPQAGSRRPGSGG